MRAETEHRRAGGIVQRGSGGRVVTVSVGDQDGANGLIAESANKCLNMGRVAGTGIDYGNVSVTYHVSAGTVERVVRRVVADDPAQQR